MSQATTVIMMIPVAELYKIKTKTRYLAFLVNSLNNNNSSKVAI